jgi:hypothetical protein
MTRDFETYYTHAAPFERRALAQAWRRCLSGSRQAATCRAEFARLQARIGSLDEALSGPGGSTPGG